MMSVKALLVLLASNSVYAGNYSNPMCASGRTAITQLFEWKWSDIKAECQRFLGPYGYCGVQVSPPNENAVITSLNYKRPWWERYQPVSYKLVTRSGNEQEFIDMVNTCNQHNVRIYVDAVINHMASPLSGIGTAGNHYDGVQLSYPGVPYNISDFKGKGNDSDRCATKDGKIHNYNDPNEVRNCRLVGFPDLAQNKEHVRSKIAEYMNHLIDIGVAGFRVDGSKFMWPRDLSNIFARLTNLNSTIFGSNKKPFIYQEIYDMGDGPIRMSQYYGTGRVTNFDYGKRLSDIFLVRDNQAKWLSNFGSAWGMPSSGDVVVFLSNHDNQRGNWEGGGPLTFFHAKQMKIANAFMMAWPYGFPRIMSSYMFKRHVSYTDEWMGPPHDGNMNIRNVKIHPDMSCGGGWVCEHRWRQVYNMVAFRNVVDGTPVQNWWSSGDFQIAFSRGNKGFIVINAGSTGTLNAYLNTGLPRGAYCDVISGNYENGKCTGSTVNVGSNGQAYFNIDASFNDTVVAIHIGVKVGSTKRVIT